MPCWAPPPNVSNQAETKIPTDTRPARLLTWRTPMNTSWFLSPNDRCLNLIIAAAKVKRRGRRVINGSGRASKPPPPAWPGNQTRYTRSPTVRTGLNGGAWTRVARAVSSENCRESVTFGLVATRDQVNTMRGGFFCG